MCDEHVVAVMIALDTCEIVIVKVYKRVDFEVVQFYLLQSSFIKITCPCDVFIGLLSNAVAIILIVWLDPYSYWNSNWVRCSLDINVYCNICDRYISFVVSAKDIWYLRNSIHVHSRQTGLTHILTLCVIYRFILSICRAIAVGNCGSTNFISPVILLNKVCRHGSACSEIQCYTGPCLTTATLSQEF